MKKYFAPQMEIESFDGVDLFATSTFPEEGGDCTQEGQQPGEGCGDDVGFDPGCPAVFGPEIFD